MHGCEKRSAGASSGPGKNSRKSSVSWVWNEDLHCGYADGQVVFLVAGLPSLWDGIRSASLRLLDFFSRSR